MSKKLNYILSILLFLSFSIVVYGATRGIVPRADNEGTIGTSAKNWSAVYSMKYYGDADRVIPDYFYPSFTIATTTDWTATTSLAHSALGVASIGETWDTIQCFTDTGTLLVECGDGTNAMDTFTASTTVGTITLTTNNSFTAGEKRYCRAGTPASSPSSLSCTVKKHF